ncbi:M24 family metallopeptidase [Candidatus Micrarchaeota archaeon]|nr:M24 family metallopeptidase [Candidatus Micrarchaeota archaeon]
MNRLSKLTKIVAKQPVLLMSWSTMNPNAYYFTGIDDDAFAVFMTRNETIAYGHGSYGFADETREPKDMREHFWDYVKKHGIRKIGVDESDGALYSRLIQKKVAPVPLHAQFQKMRAVKDSSEIACIQRAQKITKKTFEEVLPHMDGKTENHVAGLLELSARKKGAALDAFPPIVASGPNGAQPHARPAKRIIKKTECTVVDLGAKYRHYCGDFTSTVFEGKNPEQKDAVLAVLESYEAARKKAKIGVHGKTLNRVAQDVIKEYGFAKNSFAAIGLRLGHSVGLEVHDGFGVEDVTLKKGMAVTIEPGIYVPGKFGVRFEDIVTL